MNILDSTVSVLRAHGLTTIFGNPGSNELPFLGRLPDDFDYVLGLQEAVVMGMADGYAQASGKPALVSLHAASGTGNGMGALTNAFYSHSPLILLAGQQMRRTVGQEVMLANVDATILPRPLVKYSSEPLSPQDVPRTLSQAVFEATTSPKGPVYVSVPMDDWEQPALDDDVLLAGRSVRMGGALSSDLLAELAARLDGFKSPVLVLGPDVDACRAQASAVALAQKLGAPVWVAPSAPRCPFPTTHAAFRGVLPPGIKSVRERLEGHDGVLVIGAPVMRYHRWEPDAYLPAGAQVIHITSDAGEATRAPYGESIVAEVGGSLAALAGAVTNRGVRIEPRSLSPIPRTADGLMAGLEVLDVLNEFRRQHTRPIVYVNESTTLDLTFLDHVHMDEPGMYHFPASGGLGFGLPAAVGIALARPEATVVAVIGDGSTNYALPALYTAAQRGVRVVFVIVNNRSYGALRGFARRLEVESVGGLDLPGIDFVKLAEGYGVPASQTNTRDEFEAAYRAALDASGPVLLDVRVLTP